MCRSISVGSMSKPSMSDLSKALRDVAKESKLSGGELARAGVHVSDNSEMRDLVSLTQGIESLHIEQIQATRSLLSMNAEILSALSKRHDATLETNRLMRSLLTSNRLGAKLGPVETLGTLH